MAADMILTLEGQHFRRQYLLYVIEITHGNDHYYYVGQTGDNHAITARPAFRRLAGHLEDRGRSKQNQVYRYLAENVLHFSEAGDKSKNFDEKVKQAVEDYLVESTIKMYVYSLQDFPPGIEREIHLVNVRKVRLFEKIVIRQFIKYHKRIANKNIAEPFVEGECSYPKILLQIKKDFQLS